VRALKLGLCVLFFAFFEYIALYKAFPGYFATYPTIALLIFAGTLAAAFALAMIWRPADTAYKKAVVLVILWFLLSWLGSLIGIFTVHLVGKHA
jgi:hypothetical protein